MDTFDKDGVAWTGRHEYDELHGECRYLHLAANGKVHNGKGVHLNLICISLRRLVWPGLAQMSLIIKWRRHSGRISLWVFNLVAYS